MQVIKYFIIDSQVPYNQAFFVYKRASFYPDDYFINNKFLFPCNWKAATDEMKIIAELALKHREHLNQLSRKSCFENRHSYGLKLGINPLLPLAIYRASADTVKIVFITVGH